MLKNPFKKLDQKIALRQSDTLKRARDYQKIANKNLFTVGVVIVVLFATIFGRLVYLQISQQAAYLAKLEAYTSTKQVTSTPRGQMLDRNGNVVVGNASNIVITYYPESDMSEEDEWELAHKVSKRFEIGSDKLTTRDLKDLFILMSDDNGNSKLSEEELLKANKGELSNTYVYNLKLERITEEDLADFDDDLLDAYAVKQLMDMAPASQVKTILENVSNEDAAYLIEHIDEYPGFDVVFDWQREYPYGDTMRSIFGNVSTKQQGIPAEERDYFQGLGYSLNERVGLSGLEDEYEFLLNGQKTVHELEVDPLTNENFLSEVQPGKNGYDLHLSVDMELQQTLTDMLVDIFEREENNKYRRFMNRMYINLMNPETGEVYAMASVAKNEDGDYYDNASGNYLQAVTPGSIVKAATIYMGLNEEVVKPGEIIMDAPIYIQGTPPKASYRNYGLTSDVRALEVSSNVYMFHIAMRLGGTTYVPYGPLVINPEAFDLMRSYYTMFGLGVKTGIDIPFEEVGYIGTSRASGLLLDFAIGQYDSYTPLQMVQYAATIANGGYRVKPRLVTHASEPNNPDTVIFENDAEVFSQINGDTAYLERVVQGMEACVTSGNCGVKLNQLDKNVAAKTGTAEDFVFEDGVSYSVSNAALVGFAPLDNPKVAFSCSVPAATTNDVLQYNICMDIAAQALEEFFKKY